MINFTEIKNQIEEFKLKIDKTFECLKINKEIEILKEIEKKIETSTFWNVSEMTKMMQEKSRIQKIVNNAQEIIDFIKNSDELLHMAEEEGDERMMIEVLNDLNKWKDRINNFEMSVLFKKNEDKLDCFLEIHSGAGGTESQDWVQMLSRMYIMYAEKNNFSIEIIDKLNGEEAGFKQITLLIKGYLSYGYLKNENGVHRLVRVSPFNAQNKRQTSFAAVFCYPAIDETIEIEINEKDIRIDTFRSSGAGGQHVNTTDSAIRITHIPTGIVVQSQSQRSQVQNKTEAMKMLKSKLYDLELQKLNENKDIINNNKSEISFGNQIRNYVLHPYQLVKDIRSGYETSQTEKILNGDLESMIYSVLTAIKD